MPANLGIEFLLLALIILLSLIAAVGAWRTQKHMTRDDIDELLKSSEQRSSDSTKQLIEAIDQATRSAASAQLEQIQLLEGFRNDVTASMRNLAGLLDQTVTELRTSLDQTGTTLAKASEQQHENLKRNLGDLTANVNTALSEARRNQDAGIEKVEGTLQQVRADVDRAATEVRGSIMELARVHHEAKAQSAMQLCEALISSLGTLRNTIAAQIADVRPAELLGAEAPPAAPDDASGEIQANAT